MLAGVAVTLQRWPIIGRQPELEVFERVLGSGELAGLVIYGRAGVGKTRLADECRQQAAAAGYPTERVAGSRTTALVPLGAVAALLADGLGRLGPDGQVDMVALFEQTRRALRERHHGRRLVTVADDVSLLDAVSLALVGYLAAQGMIFLIATVRTGEPVPDLVTSLWRDGRLERVDLEDLSRAHLDTLLHLALGGPMEAGAGREFWEVTRGNPLYVRELVLGGLESGALVERSGVSHLQGRLLSTTRLLDLVGQRIGQLSAEALSVVELLALCQPLELGYLEATAPSGVLESLERAGLGRSPSPTRRCTWPTPCTAGRAAPPCPGRGRGRLLARRPAGQQRARPRPGQGGAAHPGVQGMGQADLLAGDGDRHQPGPFQRLQHPGGDGRLDIAELQRLAQGQQRGTERALADSPSLPEQIQQPGGTRRPALQVPHPGPFDQRPGFQAAQHQSHTYRGIRDFPELPPARASIGPPRARSSRVSR